MHTWEKLEMDSGERCLGLSADGSGMLTTSGFVPFQTRDDRPLPEQSRTSAQTQLSVAYWISDGWLWRVGRDVGPRRVCWLPPLYRRIDRLAEAISLMSYPEKERLQHGYTAAGQQVVAFQTENTGFIVLDLSACFSERRKSICITG